MGATLEFTRVEATYAKEAAVLIIYGCGETDPYMLITVKKMVISLM